jgi:short chain dehydrogenase
MRGQRSGLVVTISSTAGLEGGEFVSAYAASKFGVEGWMESLAPEVAPFGIRTMPWTKFAVTMNARACHLRRRTRRAAHPWTTSAAAVGWSPADGVIDDLASDYHQLVILVLAQRTQPDPCVVLGATAPTHQDANRLVDDGSRLQGRLQPSNQPLRLHQHLRI